MRILSVTLLILLASCQVDSSRSKIDDVYILEFDAFIKDRQEENEGYLMLCGLTGLPPLTSSYGTDTASDIRVSVEGIDGTIGFFSNTSEGVYFLAEKTVKLEDGSAVDSVSFTFDQKGNSQKLYLDHLSLRLITRSNEWYVRSWDEQNPAVEAFKPADRFELTEKFIFEADLEYFEEPISQVVSTQLGPPETVSMVGRLTFSFKGKDYTLDVGNNGFTMVADATTGEETYGGGRYIDLTLPQTSGPLTLDFNRLYNPPCTFSDYTTCQYPPEQNVLPFRIEAGEKYKDH